jgi:hypothetical protein
MLPFDDPHWETYRKGYDRYDVRNALTKLLSGETTAGLWHELWDKLHHQGDVFLVSYAAVPYLLEYARRSSKLNWNVFGLIAVIELARPENLPVPEELALAYFKAIADVPSVVGSKSDRHWDTTLTQCIAACIAIAGGQRLLAKAYLNLDVEIAKRFLEEELGWCEELPATISDLYLHRSEDGYQGLLWQGTEVVPNDFEAENLTILRWQYEERAKELGVPFVDLSLFAPHPEALFLIPCSVAQRLNVLPLSRKPEALYVAMTNINDVQIDDAVRLICRCPVRGFMASPEDIRLAIRRYYGDI